MKLKNVSNYPKTIKGVRLESGEPQEVPLDAAEAQIFRGSSSFEVLEDDDEESEDESVMSKSEEKQEEGE